MDTLEKMVKPKRFIKSGPHVSVNKDGGLHKPPTPKSYR